MDKYTEFKATAAAIKIIAYLVVTLAGVSAVGALFTEPSFGLKIVGFVNRATLGALGFALLLATSETIHVLIDIEFNTRRSREMSEAEARRTES
ncbi:MAG: hypothetical protein KC466_00630 [Myxococcales bacterium]|nr:hypothetical protein [Myxococcales bacterium]